MNRIRTGLMRRGLNVARHETTTRHAAALYPFQLDPGLGPRGVYIGENLTAGGEPWCYDPFQLYTDGMLTSPNAIILGSIGSGKSTAIKTMLYRSIGQLRSNPTGANRWVAILDPKGEYQSLAEALELEHIELKPGGSARINPLHTEPANPSTCALTLNALAATLLRRNTTPAETAALEHIATTLTAANNASVDNVITALDKPSDDLSSDVLATNAEGTRTELRELRHGLARLTGHGAHAGMLNGKTTLNLASDSRGVVFDLSNIHTDPHLLATVMVAIMSDLQQRFAAEGNIRRILVLEEAWAVLQNESVARHYQSWQKLSRSLGVATIATIHRPADLTAQTDDGSAAAKIATGIIADTQTRILFRQPPDQLARCRELFGLNEVQLAVIAHLGRGESLWHLPTGTARVRHRVAGLELETITTDARVELQQISSVRAC